MVTVEDTPDPYRPTTPDPYRSTTPDPYRPTTPDPYRSTTPDPYRPTTPTYPHDPYEPYDPYDPYPYYFCELNEDEYGRPYYGPYDEYHPPSQPYPVLPSQLYPVPSYPPHSYPTPDDPMPEPKGYRSRLPAPNSPPPAVYLSDAYAQRLELVTGKKKRQSSPLPFPACVISNECTQRSGT